MLSTACLQGRIAKILTEEGWLPKPRGEVAFFILTDNWMLSARSQRRLKTFRKVLTCDKVAELHHKLQHSCDFLPGPMGSFASSFLIGRVSFSLVEPSSVNSPDRMRSPSSSVLLPDDEGSDDLPLSA